ALPISGDEADGIDRERLERANPSVGMREEQLRKDETGDGRIEEKIVPLDGGANGGSNHGTSKLHPMLVGAEAGRLGIGCRHGALSWLAPIPIHRAVDRHRIIFPKTPDQAAGSITKGINWRARTDETSAGRGPRHARVSRAGPP